MGTRNGPRDLDTILSCRYWLTDAAYDLLDREPTLADQAAMLGAVSVTVSGPREAGD